MALRPAWYRGRHRTLLGEKDINIAYMPLGCRSPRGEAIMVLALDEAIPEIVSGDLEYAV